MRPILPGDAVRFGELAPCLVVGVRGDRYDVLTPTATMHEGVPRYMLEPLYDKPAEGDDEPEGS